MAEIQNVKIVNGVVVFPDYVPNDPNNKVYDVGAAQELIANLLGVGKRSDGKYHTPDICISSRINIYAAFKPEEYNTQANLTYEQRKANGFGITIQNATGVTIKTLANIHNAKFIYTKPSTWKRLRDFNGYAHNAQPKPYATFGSSEGYYNDDSLSFGGLSVNMSYANGDTTGVDFTERLIGNVSLDTILKRAFPCILLTKKSNGKSYFTALDYTGNGVESAAPRPLKVLESYAQNAWMVRMSKKMMNGPDEMSSPFGTETVTASLFLMQSASTSTPLLVTSGTNFGTHWIEVSNNINAMYTPIVVPGAIGQTISLKQYFNGVIFTPTGVGSILTAGQPILLTIQYAETTGMTSTNDITISASVTISGGGKTFTGGTSFTGWPRDIMFPLFVETDMRHSSNVKSYEVTVSLTTKDGNVTNGSGSKTFTITA